MTSTASAQSQSIVKDAIDDFFHLNIEDRYSDASEVPWLKKITCDFEGNGKGEFFLGTSRMTMGDNTQTYCALYTLEAGKFLRLTPATSDVAIDTSYFGPRETTYCGYVKEQNSQGVLVLQDPNIIRDPDDPGLPGHPTKYLSRMFYHIKNNRLVIDDLGPLYLQTKAGNAFYKEYFGTGVLSRPVRTEK